MSCIYELYVFFHFFSSPAFAWHMLEGSDVATWHGFMKKLGHQRVPILWLPAMCCMPGSQFYSTLQLVET